ncbi:ZP4 protein, partial [Atractosteus spatula]|nr:ZP4 protein [Atractosteus spatula]
MADILLSKQKINLSEYLELHCSRDVRQFLLMMLKKPKRDQELFLKTLQEKNWCVYKQAMKEERKPFKSSAFHYKHMVGIHGDDEVDSARGLSGYTLSKMEEYVDRSGNCERLIKELREKLEEGEMEKLENKLRHMQTKNGFILNWSTARKLASNQELRSFLIGGNRRIFPTIVLNQFFRVRLNQCSGICSELGESTDEKQTANESTHPTCRNPFIAFLDSVSPSAMVEQKIYPKPLSSVDQSTLTSAHGSDKNQSVEDLKGEEENSCGPSLNSSGYDSLSSYISEKTIGTIPNSDRSCIPEESVPKAPCGISPGERSGTCEDGTRTFNSEVEGPSGPRGSGSVSTLTLKEKCISGTNTGNDTGRKVDILFEESNHMLERIMNDTDLSQSPTLFQKDLHVSDEVGKQKEEDLRKECFSLSKAKACSSLSEEAQSNYFGTTTPARRVSEVTSSSRERASLDSEIRLDDDGLVLQKTRPTTRAPSAESARSTTRNNETKEQIRTQKGSRRTSQKKQNDQHEKRSMLKEWARKKVFCLKGGTSEEEKMGAVRAGISIINLKEHKLYPCLVAEQCLVFEDPETSKRRIIEIGEVGKILSKKKGEFTEEFGFKLQFQMGVFADICETDVVLPGKIRTIAYDELLFEKVLKTFLKYIHEAVLPALAVFKKFLSEFRHGEVWGQWESVESVCLAFCVAGCGSSPSSSSGEQYDSYYSEGDYPVTKVLQDPVYVEVHILQRTDPNIVLTLGDCWATSTPSPLSQPQWSLLVAGCPYRDDNYQTTLIPVGGSSGLLYPTHYQRFMVRMFTFVDPASQLPLKETVYIHCSAAVCQPTATDRCVPTCISRRRRAVAAARGGSSKDTAVVSSGEVILTASELPAQGEAHRLWSEVPQVFSYGLLAVAASTVLVVSALLLVAVWRFRPCTQNKAVTGA